MLGLIWNFLPWLTAAYLALALLDLAISAQPSLRPGESAGKLFVASLCWVVTRPVKMIMWVVGWIGRRF